MFLIMIHGKFLTDKFIASSELIILIVLDTILLIFGKFITLPLQTINKFNYIGFFDMLVNLTIYISLLYLNVFNDIILVFKIILAGSFTNIILRVTVYFYFVKKLKLFAH